MSSSPLFTPFTWGHQELKNRMVLAPLTRARAGADRVPNALMADYYEQRAGAGLLIAEATVISEEGIGWVDSPGIYTDEMVAGWRLVTDRVHAAGSKIILQLWHCGRASHSDFHQGERPLSASAIAIEGDQIHTPNGKKDYEVPRAMSLDDIRRTIADYKQAARNAKAAGFDGVEVHGANGYLVNQFLETKTNHRDDEYGGSLENRFRFFREAVEAVCEVFDPGQVGVRVSPNGVFNDMGSEDYRETHHYVAEQFQRMNIGYMHVMDGLAFGFHEKGEPVTLAEIRARYKGMIIGNCGHTKEDAEALIASGDADLIAFGRPFITNPDLPERFRHDWPLNDFSDASAWYGSGAEGYTDFPSYSEAS